jgi:hypothetical protein
MERLTAAVTWAIIVEATTVASSTILTIFRAWVSMPFGFHPSLTITMEDIMVIGVEICIS